MSQTETLKTHENLEILREIAACRSHEHFCEISEQSIHQLLNRNFPLLFPSQQIQLAREKDMFPFIRGLAEEYLNINNMLQTHQQRNSYSINIINESNQRQQVDFERRKITRAMFAMRNVKNQEQLKKDQIFVRAIPKSQSCIGFMLNNKNFPRIQVKLSCNQHLQYLINYLSNKWLRGKVGVGYQILLYPDPAQYLRRLQSQEPNKTLDPRHEPLNNYLMFTDIIAAYGNPHQASLNLYYQVIEMRKQKNRIIRQKQIPNIPNFPNLPNLLKPQFLDPHQSFAGLSTPIKHKYPDKKQQISIEKKGSQNDKHLGSKDKKVNYNNNVGMFEGHFDEDDYASLPFNWNNFNSNNIASNFFNNASNTFLHAGSQIYNPILSNANQPHRNQSSIPEKQVNDNQKLKNIRNYISMVEQEGKGSPEPLIESGEKEKDESSMKDEVNQKKQVKTISIIRKKMPNQ